MKFLIVALALMAMFSTASAMNEVPEIVPNQFTNPASRAKLLGWVKNELMKPEEMPSITLEEFTNKVIAIVECHNPGWTWHNHIVAQITAMTTSIHEIVDTDDSGTISLKELLANVLVLGVDPVALCEPVQLKFEVDAARNEMIAWAAANLANGGTIELEEFQEAVSDIAEEFEVELTTNQLHMATYCFHYKTDSVVRDGEITMEELAPQIAELGHPDAANAMAAAVAQVQAAAAAQAQAAAAAEAAGANAGAGASGRRKI